MTKVRYAGFGIRFIASFMDTLFLAIPIGIIVYFISDGNWFDFTQYKQNILAAMSGNVDKAITNMPQIDRTWDIINLIILITVSMIFWKKSKGATPGKKFANIKVVDAKSFGPISNKQAITRSFGYIVSTLTFLIGFLLVLFREDKRGLHDLLAGTAVIYDDD